MRINPWCYGGDRSNCSASGNGLQQSFDRLSPETSSLAAGVKTPVGRPARFHQLPALTGLRFFLALWVIINHLVGNGNIYEPIAVLLPGPLQAIIRGGYQAVPIFFMLSGFVLARSYAFTEWNSVSVWKYLVGRFARIYPVYLLSLLIVLPFIVESKEQPKGWLVTMHLTLTQGWWVGHYKAGWNTPAWSLSCEMFFYLIFPPLILIMRDWGWRRTIGAALLSCMLTKMMLGLGIPDQVKPIFHLSDFLMGIVVCRAFDLLSERGLAPTGKWFCRIGLVGSTAIIGYAQFVPKLIPLNTLLRPMNALLLLGLGLGGGWVARVLSARPIVFLGKASYGMYILHVPILWWAVGLPKFAVRYLYVAFVVAISSVVYAVFEEPANRAIRALVGAGQHVERVPEDQSAAGMQPERQSAA